MRRIVFIGNKDHGKSTIIGRLLYDLGAVKADRLEALKSLAREGGRVFEFAHILDSFREERERKMTLDTTRVIAEIDGARYELIDVPGHEELIRNMITGANEATAAVLVVSVKEGIEPQTIQHCRIARFLGIERIAVALNKMDLVSYSQEVLESFKKELTALLSKVGYDKKNISFIPISATYGENLVKKSGNMPWYRGATLLETITKKGKEISSKSDSNSPLILPIQDTITADGETIFLGTIETGTIAVGQKIFALPSREKVTIRAILSLENKKIPSAKQGENIGIVILPIPEGMGRGSILTTAPKSFSTLDSFPCVALLIKKPSAGSLTFYSRFQESEGTIAPSTFEPGVPTSAYVTLKKPLLITSSLGETTSNKIVIEEKGEIVGLAKLI